MSQDYEQRALLAEQKLSEITARLARVESLLTAQQSNSAPTSAPEAEEKKLHKSELSLDERYALCRTVGEECVQEDELRALLARKDHPVCYDGFEPSGRMHIAQGILKAINVNRLTRSGCKFVFWVADWFAMLNNKMDGDLKKIQTVGKYLIEIWKAAGMDMNNVEFLWASEEINKRPNEYWLRVMDIARRNNLTRLMRCATIMGREEKLDMPAAHILYPCMQCADIFFLKADICQLGMDQRKVNMLAREYCDDAGIRNKPIILSHHMLMGLGGQVKMSKSDPDSAIFMEDTAADVNRKIKKSLCAPQQVEGNPCLDYVKHIVFGRLEHFVVERSEANGGNREYKTYEEVEEDYRVGQLHPGDLKPALAKAINEILEPVRQHFENDPEAKKLLKAVKSFKVTR